MTRLLWLALFPLVWSAASVQTPSPAGSTAPAPTASSWAWRQVRAATAPLDAAGREALAVPGIVPRPGIASPTRAPWVQTNGWRYLRNPGGPFSYELPAGKGALGVAEALTYGGDVAIRIDPADAAAVDRLFAFVKDLPSVELPDLADFGIVDDGTALTGEVMNLFVRRNLLFARVTEPTPRFPFTVKLGTPEYPNERAADPSAFALAIRRKLTDDQRSLRIYGSELMIARATGNATRGRVHLLNYGVRDLTGLRLRIRGEYSKVEVLIPGQGRVAGTDVTSGSGFTELTLPSLQTYSVVELGK